MIPRYTLPEMGDLWSQEAKYESWRRVEIAALRGWASLGAMPVEAAEEVQTKTWIDVERIEAIEAEVHHDMIAFVTSLSEQVGDVSRHIHYGLTSSDVLDTALGLQLKAAGELLLDTLDVLISTLGSQANRYKHTPMMGRTHGVHAEPITFGLKLALWYEELLRARDRLQHAVAQVSVGKISGATGTYAQVPPELEERVCQELGLAAAPISSQIVGRDRHAVFLSELAILGSVLEKHAVEIRGLQRTEVGEVAEPFRSGQKGSSAMPHKRNPILTERITGMARLLRGNLLAALENIPLWHERDISHSSVERVILPDSTIICHYMMRRMIDVMADLDVFPERMLENMNLTGGAIFSQRVLLALVAAGMRREDAYRIVQTAAMEGIRGPENFRQQLEHHPDVSQRLTDDALAACFRVEDQLIHVDTIFERLGL